MTGKRTKDKYRFPLLLTAGQFRGKDRKGVTLLYEDDYIIVADKPSGLLTVSTGKEGELTAYSVITDYVRSRCRNGRYDRRKDRIFIVHRIDRDTSGILVFAKDPQTKYELQENWNERVIERRYIAILEGIPPEPEGTVTSWLKDNPVTKFVTSSPYDNGGKKAITHYRVTGNYGQSYSLVEFELETGRKNQIRVHASLMGNPIAGDRKYGARTNPISRLALHAKSISFRHPVTGETLTFDSGIPVAFRKPAPTRKKGTERKQTKNIQFEQEKNGKANNDIEVIG